MKKNNKNNKGFSLVELIIVIAIMAILIGVLAPQYLKFVERSRKSTDRSNVDEIVRAVEIYAADPTVTTTPTNGTVTIKTASQSSADAGSNDYLDAALDAAGIDTVILKSSKWVFTSGSDLILTFTFDTEGNVTVTSNCKTGEDQILE